MATISSRMISMTTSMMMTSMTIMTITAAAGAAVETAISTTYRPAL